MNLDFWATKNTDIWGSKVDQRRGELKLQFVQSIDKANLNQSDDNNWDGSQN